MEKLKLLVPLTVWLLLAPVIMSIGNFAFIWFIIAFLITGYTIFTVVTHDQNSVKKIDDDHVRELFEKSGQKVPARYFKPSLQKEG